MTYPAYPYQPFKRPVPAPPVDPAGAFCWTFDRKWLPYVRGCLFALIHDRTWKTDVDRAVGEASNLLASLAEAGECFPDDNDCVDIFPIAPIVEWIPTSPFTEPEVVPPGYLFPPFHAVNESDTALLLAGFQVGDVLTGLPNVPIVPTYPTAESPTFDVHVVGTGVVELHLLQFLTGGSAVIIRDQELEIPAVIELAKDVISLPPETVTELVHEVTFDTPGPHRVRVIFTGKFTPELVILGFGGGIRKIVLCGFDEMGDWVDVRQNETDKCKLEKSVDGTNWTQFADLQKCPPIIRRNGQQIQYGIPDEEGVTFFTFPEADETILGEAEAQWPPENVPAGESGACLAAENIVAMLQQEVTEWVNTLEAGGTALGLASVIAGILAFFIVPPLSVALLGFATVIVGVGASGLAAAFTTTVYDRFKCILFCHASSDGAFTVDEYADVLSDIQAESGTAWDIIEQWVDFRGAVGLTRMAAAAGITDGDCDDCDCGWCYLFDFTATDGDFTPISGLGTYSGGTGWQAVLAGDYDMYIQRTFPETFISTVRLRITFTQVDETTVVGVFGDKGSGEVLLAPIQAGIIGTNDYNFTVNDECIDIRPNPSNSENVSTLIECEVHGLGDNPFGTDNC